MSVPKSFGRSSILALGSLPGLNAAAACPLKGSLREELPGEELLYKSEVFLKPGLAPMLLIRDICSIEVALSMIEVASANLLLYSSSELLDISVESSSRAD